MKTNAKFVAKMKITAYSYHVAITLPAYSAQKALVLFAFNVDLKLLRRLKYTNE
jgi:hypothetical protein